MRPPSETALIGLKRSVPQTNKRQIRLFRNSDPLTELFTYSGGDLVVA
jgi:hypothetical protein